MSVFEQYYDATPLATIDQNKWTENLAEVKLQERNAPLVYTPLVDWKAVDSPQVLETELMEGEVNPNPIPWAANYIDPMSFDSRKLTLSVARYGAKVQMSDQDDWFNRWMIGGSRSMKPILENILSRSLIDTVEMVVRNNILGGSKAHWSYAGTATNIGELTATDKADPAKLREIGFRLGSVGNPIVPEMPDAIVGIVPPGFKYDFRSNLAANLSSGEAFLLQQVGIHQKSDLLLRGQIDQYDNMRFVAPRSDRYGINAAVLYNTGTIEFQARVTAPVRRGDGAPDPDTTKVDEVFWTGQRDATHFVQLEDFGAADFEVNDIVTIHKRRTAVYGVSMGVDPLDGLSIQRRVVGVNHTDNRLTFDRPILFEYSEAFQATSYGTTGSDGTTGVSYAFVTKALNIGMNLFFGSRGGLRGPVLFEPKFTQPRAIDDFESVWRSTWQWAMGVNVVDPSAFEVHFTSVSVPKVGGIITGA